MNFRNPAFNRFATIDVEIEHPVLGWIPFTVNPQDEGAGFDVAALDAAIRQAGNIAPFVPPPPPGPTVPPQISKVQFVRASRAAGYWDAYRAQVEAHPDWAYITEIPRTDPMVLGLAQSLGFTDAQLDALWIAGAAL